jgi:hypothetical protein
MLSIVVGSPARCCWGNGTFMTHFQVHNGAMETLEEIKARLRKLQDEGKDLIEECALLIYQEQKKYRYALEGGEQKNGIIFELQSSISRLNAWNSELKTELDKLRVKNPA